MPTEKEMKKIELATVYEIRLIFAADDRETYTTEEIYKILDQYAIDKNAAV